MQVVSLSSGSHGNAILVQTSTGALLVDAGLPYKTLLARCATVGTRAEDICGIVLTHEHGDHTTCVATLVRKLRIPVITMPATLYGVNVPSDVTLIPLTHEQHVIWHGIRIDAWPVSHDAIAPVALRITVNDVAVAIATDLGTWDSALATFMQPAELIVIEANHDRERLRMSSYDAQLKLRIASPNGHLDNFQAGTLLSEIARDGRLRDVWLAHLSREANSPELAVRSVHTVLAMHKRTQRYRTITALPRHTHEVWGPAQRTRQQSLWQDD